VLKPNLDYPIRLDIDEPGERNRLSVFFRWLLVIPHWIALTFVGIAGFFAIVVAWFATLFTGRWPHGLFEFELGIMRWSARVSAYMLLLTDRYPPFSLAEDPDYPARLAVDYPEQIAQWRPLVNWILIIPYAYAAGALLYAAYFVSIGGWFAILFTGRYPEGMFEFTAISLRWTMRQNGYQLWMTERYPPFEWG
jgi:hypothetical protein